jgi:shikimate dehydrogenase
VTAPFKENIIEFLDSLDPVAEAVGAVNCVKVIDFRASCVGVGRPTRLKIDEPEIGRQGERLASVKLTGYNTDALALREIFQVFLGGDTGIKALIIGTGGAAKAAAWALGESGVSYSMASARGPINIGDNRLIINATPLGSYVIPGGEVPVDYDALTSEHYLFDMVYNPAETPFLREGRERGAQVRGGMEMLLRQAELSRLIWGA